jgi:D-threo-aldose 1-dehydrogenase
MTALPTRPLGRTPLRVTALGFGAAPLGGLYREVSAADAGAAVETALAAGVAYFDTAPLYGHGLSEHRLGQALREVPRDRFILSTKVGRLLRPARAASEPAGLVRLLRHSIPPRLWEELRAEGLLPATAPVP